MLKNDDYGRVKAIASLTEEAFLSYEKALEKEDPRREHEFLLLLYKGLRRLSELISNSNTSGAQAELAAVTKVVEKILKDYKMNHEVKIDMLHEIEGAWIKLLSELHPSNSISLNDYARLEGMLRKLLVQKMKARGDKWLSSFAPQDVKEALTLRASKDNVDINDESVLVDYLTLSDVIKVINKNDNWEIVFEEAFLKNGWFDNREQVIYELNTLNKKGRNPHIHVRESDQNKEIANAIARKVIKFLETHGL